jgi:cysteine synthase B
MGILEAIGETPLVPVEHLNPNPRVRLLAKLEGNNPGGSVKDRIAHHMIRMAVESGVLTPGKVILEATSGNTGIGLAMVGAAMGYRVKLAMPGCVSIERRRILEAFGAEIVLTPSCEATDGAIREAHRILEEEPDAYYMPNQFDNPANWEAHYLTTGPEIIRQTGGTLTAFVAGMGTTGTLMGVSRSLKEHDPAIRIVGVEPNQGHTIQGLKNMTESIVPGIYQPERLDEKVNVADEDAFAMTRDLALREGIFAGMSCGAAMVAACDLARRMEGGTVVVLLPDRGDRYLSTNLFTSICAKCPP